MVIIQICCAHFMRIGTKDVEAQYKDEEIKNFVKWQMWCGINIGKYIARFLLTGWKEC